MARAPDFQGHVEHVEELRVVRQQLRGLVSSVGDEDFSFRLVLAADELLANGVVHTTGGCTIAVWFDPGSRPRIRVEVADLDDEQPAMHPAGAFRGLRIVDRAASRWGVEPRMWGKAVWFEIV